MTNQVYNQAFEIRGDEEAASQARERWVTEAVRAARERAANKWGK